MIARLAGIVLEKQPDRVVLDVRGVGYLVSISFQTYQERPAAAAEAALWIHTHVREDSLALFGFASVREKCSPMHRRGPMPKGMNAAFAESRPPNVSGARAGRREAVHVVRNRAQDGGSARARTAEKAEKLHTPTELPLGTIPRTSSASSTSATRSRRQTGRRGTPAVAPPEFADFLKEALAPSGS
jgi:hypothetical protein